MEWGVEVSLVPIQIHEFSTLYLMHGVGKALHYDQILSFLRILPNQSPQQTIPPHGSLICYHNDILTPIEYPQLQLNFEHKLRFSPLTVSVEGFLVR